MPQQFLPFDPRGQIGPAPGAMGMTLPKFDLPEMPAPFGKPLPRKRRRKQVPEITPEERESMLGRVMGGLEYLGNLIDKPAAAYRGTLHGLIDVAQGETPEWGGGLANLIPFSDTLGITDPKERLYHRDIYENLGLAPKNVKGFHPFKNPEDAFWDTISLTSDMVFDPLILVRGPTAALTPAGRAMEASANAMNKLGDVLPHLDDLVKGISKTRQGRIMGKTVAGMVKEIEQGHRGLVALKVPFAKEAFAVFGGTPGTTANTIAAKSLDWLYYGAGSPMPYVRQLLSKTVAGTPGGAAQRAKDLVISELGQWGAGVKNALPIFGREIGKLTNETLPDMAQMARLQGDEVGFEGFNDMLRFLLEHTDKAKNNLASQKAIRKMFDSAIDKGEIDAQAVGLWADNMAQLVNTMAGTKDIIARRVDDLGGNITWLDDMFASHFFRRPSNRVAREVWELEATKRVMPGVNHAGRLDPLRNIPEGTRTLNLLAMEELLTGELRGKELKAALFGELSQATGLKSERFDDLTIKQLQTLLVGEKYLKPAAAREGADPKIVKWLLDGLPVDEMDARKYKKALEALERGETTQEAVGKLADLLPNNPLKKGEKLTESMPSRAEELVDYFTAIGNHEAKLRKAGVEFQSIRETGLFDRSVMTDWMDYANHMAEAAASLQSAHYLLRRTATMPTGTTDDALKMTLGDAWRAAKTKEGHRILSDKGLDTFIADYAKANNLAPEQAKNLAKTLLVDPKTPDVIAAYTDMLRPEVQTWLGKSWDATTKLAKTYWTTFPAFHARNWVDGTWRNLARSGSDTWGPMGLLKAMVEHASYALSGGKRGAADFLGYADEYHQLGVGRGGQGLITNVVSPLGEVPKRGWKPTRHWWKPWAVGGQEGAPANILAQYHTNVYGAVEDMNRLPAYVAARRGGKTPAQAMDLINHIQFDYSKGVKNSVEWKMRKLVPFWGFVSNNIPYQMGQLINRPGGGHAQTLRVIGAMQRTEGSEGLPGWLRERISIPLGGTEEATSVVRQLGLSIEDLSDFSFEGGLPSSRTLERLLSRAHPAVTTPYKLGAGRDPYTGRPTSQMHGIPGLPAWLNTIIYSSPGSRGLTTYEMLSHPKKSVRDKTIDFLTGIKIGTYDLPKQRLYEMRNLVERRAKADPSIWSDEYFYPGRGKKKKELPPASQQTLADLKRLTASIRELRKRQAQ